MSYYNRAALLGGMSMGDALAQLGGTEGGWAVPDEMRIESFTQDPNRWDGLPRAMDQFNAVSRFVIPDGVLKPVLAAVYGYDSYLAQGEPALARDLKRGWIDGNEAKKTVWNYVRRKMHAGLTKPERMTKIQREDLRAKAAARRKAIQNQLNDPNFAWFGSNPYTGQRSKVTGNYRGLWFTPPGATGNRGLALEYQRQIPTYILPAPAAAAANPGVKMED